MSSLFHRFKQNPKLYMVYLIGRVLQGSIIMDKLYLKLLYRAKLHKKLDLRHPKSFNEKLQWLKLYDRNPEYTRMVDKYEAKQYVAERIGEDYIIPTLGVWNSFDEIDFDALPEQFVLKCTHDSGGLVICRDKSKLDIPAARAKIEHCLKRNYFYNTREWPYKNVKPRIIAEKYMEDESCIVPEDYKVYCFNGEPKLVVVFHNRFNDEEELSETVYNTSWEKQPYSLDAHFKISDITEDKPDCLEELLKLSGALSTGLVQSRIDFYIINGKIYFGEITLCTASGLQPMIPEEMDVVIGNWIKLPEKSKCEG